MHGLAERIEDSQPVLYSHFAGKSAGAEQGFAELGESAARWWCRRASRRPVGR
ncbi:hypothetical protein [Nocardia abscessus]|uniref:hypothetical protein n=1 Tax=Nocardia abscessus TaxID=120957 RepID=UPI0027E0C798|nr:hypothetical protein [Nocardia abscessus]